MSSDATLLFRILEPLNESLDRLNLDRQGITLEMVIFALLALLVSHTLPGFFYFREKFTAA